MNYQGNGTTATIATFLLLIYVCVCVYPSSYSVGQRYVSCLCISKDLSVFVCLFWYVCFRGVGHEGMHTWCEGNR